MGSLWALFRPVDVEGNTLDAEADGAWVSISVHRGDGTLILGEFTR